LPLANNTAERMLISISATRSSLFNER